MDYSSTLKKSVFQVSAHNFNETALEIFRFQAKNNKVYNRYLGLRKVFPENVSRIEDIPFLPVEFFKHQRVVTGEWYEEAVFYSSGTTGTERSAHFIRDLYFYQKVSASIFESKYGPLQDYIFLALLPSYLENKSSSLIYMINHFMGSAPNTSSGFIKELEKVEETVQKALQTGKKVILWGVAYALLDLAESFPQDLSDVIVMETGGMKGKRKELVREELHEILQKGLKIASVHSEYGMTELLSQAYSAGKGIYACPPWMKILVREPNDPFSVKENGSQGAINIIDLANIDSCSFLETRDLGSVDRSGAFEVKGRIDNSDLRGCNLLYIN